MSAARQDAHASSRAQQRVPSLNFHHDFTGKNVEKLLRLPVMVPHFACPRGNEFFDHAQAGILYQMPAVAIVSPTVVLGVGAAYRMLLRGLLGVLMRNRMGGIFRHALVSPIVAPASPRPEHWRYARRGGGATTSNSVILISMNASLHPDPRPDPKREMLRHALATVAYRGGKAIRGAPEGFAGFCVNEGVRAPGKLLAHLGDLMEWALTISMGKREWREAQPQVWEKEIERFFAALKKLDDYLASSEPLHTSAEKLLQGPIADSLTHIGQIAMLRRIAGEPMKSENYYEAEMVAGRVGAEQTKPKREF